METISLRASSQEKNRVKRMARKRGFPNLSAFLFWLIHQARIGKIVFVLSLGLWLSGCARSYWNPIGHWVETKRIEAETERQRLELEKQKQSNQNPTSQPDP